MANITDLRKKLKQARADLNHTTRVAFDKTICEILSIYIRSKKNSSTIIKVAGFWPINDEPDLRPLLSELSQLKRTQVLLPVVLNKNTPLQFKQWTLDQSMTQGAFGILEPTGTIDIPNIILTPLLGFTEDGDRIGYGGGFYDRTIAQLRKQQSELITVGVGYSVAQITDKTYRPEAHDAPLDGIITERGWIKEPSV